MRIQVKYLIGAILVIVCLLGAALHTALAQSGDGYDLTWNTLDGGGALVSADGSYSLSGTFGQTDAGEALTGGGYSLVGGFWSGIPAFFLNLPLVVR